MNYRLLRLFLLPFFFSSIQCTKAKLGNGSSASSGAINVMPSQSGSDEITAGAETHSIPAGTLVDEFGEHGVQRIHIGSGTFDQIRSIAIQGDGKIVVAGSSKSASELQQFAIARFLSNGQLDTDFGTQGAVITQIGFGASEATGVAIQADGKIIAAGYSYQYDDAATPTLQLQITLARYLEDGTFDSSFNAGLTTRAYSLHPGIVIAPARGKHRKEWATGIKILSDQKLMLSGNSINMDDGKKYALALKFLSNGAFDTEFGDDTNPSTRGMSRRYGYSANTITLRTDNAGAYVMANASTPVGLVRLNALGAWDGGYGIFSNNQSVTGTLLASDTLANGKVIGAGYSSGRLLITRYAEDTGTFDPSFNPLPYTDLDGNAAEYSGFSYISLEGHTDAQANAVLGFEDESIIAAGRSTDNSGNTNVTLVRVDSQGRLDSTFGNAGVVHTPVSDAHHSIAMAMAEVPGERKIVVGGYAARKDDLFNADFVLTQYHY